MSHASASSFFGFPKEKHKERDAVSRVSPDSLEATGSSGPYYTRYASHLLSSHHCKAALAKVVPVATTAPVPVTTAMALLASEFSIPGIGSPFKLILLTAKKWRYL